MERPHGDIRPKQRQITGEIVYLDEMRRSKTTPTPFIELSDMAIQMYENQADLYEARGIRPEIMDDYERYDSNPSEVVASCTALANELLKLKEPDSSFTFVDIVVEASPDTVLTKLQNTSIGRVLAGENEQLAIPSNGEYYPILDIRKRNATLVGVSLTVWGWDDIKLAFTDDDEQATLPRDVLLYPSDEKSSTRRLELSFSYRDEKSGGFSESVSLSLRDNESASVSSNVWAGVYAETGYEGHKISTCDDFTDDDIAAFGDIVAEIIGDNPETIAMRTNRRLQEIRDAAATPAAQRAVQDLIEATWPAQAAYFLTRKLHDTGKTIADQLADETTVDMATEAIYAMIKKWNDRKK